MQAFVAAIIIKVLSDPKVQAYIENLVSKLISQQILPLLPVATAAAAKAVMELLPGGKVVTDLGKVTEQVRGELSKIIPDINWGPLDGVIDWWRPKP